MRRVAPALLLGLLLAGCGGGGTETVTVTQTVTTTVTTTETLPQGTTTVRVYFLRDGKVAAAGRRLDRTPAIAAAALRELFAGPSADEERFGFESALPDVEAPTVSIEQARALVRGLAGDAAREALAQVVYTLTQFPTVDAVEVGGRSYTRATFEELTPGILVESPLPGEQVTAPLRVTGTANTFEATFEYELVGPGGQMLASDFATATSGSGTRGTFDLRIPFEVQGSGLGKLVVFERSAADGSRTDVVEIPLRFGA